MKVPQWRTLVVALLLLLAGKAAYAQRSASRDTTRDTTTTRYVLPRIEITAVRERATPPPVSVFNVPAAALQRTQAANSFDLIRRVGGVEVHEQGQGPGFASDVVVRGFTSDHSADVLLVVDGVPINLPINGHGEGYADWNVLLPAAVSASRVIYGTASPLYGDFALGGVVEVFTAADADGTATSMSGSNYGDVSGWLRTGQRRANSGELVAIGLKRQQGWRNNSDYYSGNVLLRGWHSLGRGRIEGGLGTYLTRWNSPGFLSVAQYNARDLELAVDPTDGGDEARVVGHARFATELGAKGGLQVSTWLLWSDWNLFLNQPESIDEPVEQVGEIDHRLGAGAQVEYTRALPKGELTFGVSSRADGARYRIGETEERERVATRESLLARYQEAALYARWRPQLGNRLGIDLGARADLVRHQAFDRTDPAPLWQSATASVISPKLGAQYRLSERTALRASFSRGFRSAVGVIGDPGRPPILAWASDVGVRYATGALDLQAAFFRMDVDRERRLDPVTLEISSAGSSVRQGVDGRATWRPVERFALRGSFTYNHARLNGIPADAHDDHNQQSSVVPAASVALAHAALMHPTTDEGKNVPGVAEYFGSVGADLTTRRLLWSADWRVFGPYIPIGEPDVKTQPYSLLDLALSVPLSSRTTFDLSLQNALDIRYPELRASGYINPGAPRTLRAAVRIDANPHTF